MAATTAPKRVRKAILPVGGLGTRFLPATKAMPKEMLPVVDKPLVQYAMEEALAAGIDQLIFVTGRGKAAIEDHFDHSVELNAVLEAKGKTEALRQIEAAITEPGQISYIRQQNPEGLGHAVWCARHHIADEPVAVLLADDLIQGPEPCLSQMVAAYNETGGNIVAVQDVPQDQTHRYGIVAPRGDTADRQVVPVRGLQEKPAPETAPSNLAIIGRYILQPGIFGYLRDQRRGAGGEIQLTDAMTRLLDHEPFYGFRFSGQRFDCGDKVGFLEANIAFGLDRADMADSLRVAMERLVSNQG